MPIIYSKRPFDVRAKSTSPPANWQTWFLYLGLPVCLKQISSREKPCPSPADAGPNVYAVPERPTPLPRGHDEWLELAIDAVRWFIGVEKAVVWPEVDAFFHEYDGVRQFDPSFPSYRGIDPHILSEARRVLVQEGAIVKLAETLQKKQVAAWADAESLANREATLVRARAASKRRTYRRYLTWAGNTSLCGHAAERVVYASMREPSTDLFVPSWVRPGDVTTLFGREIPVGGPLDAAGLLAVDPNDPTDLVKFAVEVKNIRDVIYPWDAEMWDLLAKVASFPDVVPILLARRIHVTTFRFLSSIGALGWELQSQWFSSAGASREAIPPDNFQTIRTDLGFLDMALVNPDHPSPRVVKFFKTILRSTKQDELRGPSSALIVRAAETWGATAPVLEPFGVALRQDNLGRSRKDVWHACADALSNAGVDTRGWGPETFDEDAYDDLDGYADYGD